MNTRFVLDVCELFPFAIHLREADGPAVDDGDPGVRCETLGLTSPPAAKVRAGEADRAFLVEIGLVARLDELRDRRRVVERWWTDSELVQSGWPDSNRRLLRPKRSTLTRLSYTP
jgi:hypothetical protein